MGKDSNGNVHAYRMDYENFSVITLVNYPIPINGQRTTALIDIGIHASADSRASITLDYNDDYGYVYVYAGTNILNFLSMRLYNGLTNGCGQLFIPTK